MLEKSKLFTLWNLTMEQVRLLKDEARNSEVKRDMVWKKALSFTLAVISTLFRGGA